MAIYEWLESDYFWAVRYRPAELLDLSTLEELPPWEVYNDPDIDGQPEGQLLALNLVSGRFERCVRFFDKRFFSRKYVESWFEDDPEQQRRDARQLSLLPQPGETAEEKEQRK